MRHILFLSLLLFFSIPALAIYKCESNDKVTYSDAPCLSGKSSDIGDRTDQNTPMNIAKAKKQNAEEKEKLKLLENSRHKREAQEEKQQQRIASAAKGKKKKCQALELKHKWSKEDVANATGKKLDSAKRKERRYAEKYALECGK